MKRWILVFLVVAAILAGTAFASHWFLPKTCKLGESVVRTSVFWNNKEAFVFVSVNTNGRAMNVVQEKFTATRYGYLALLLDPPESFFKQDTTAYHLLASGKLDRVPLPERTAVFGTWTLNNGNLQLNSVAVPYNSKYGFRWDGEKFLPVAPSSASSPSGKTELTPDDEEDDDAQDGVLSGVERENFKAAGWHYKFLNAYQGRNLTVTLPMQLDQSGFNLTVHSFAMPTDMRKVIDLDGVGIRQMEISGDKLEPQILWKQNGRREISKREFERLEAQSGYRTQRPFTAVLWLLVLLLVAFWKLASWGHLLLGFGSVKKKVLNNMATSYSFPPAAPAQFPRLDAAELDRYTREFQSMGFTQLLDFSLVPDKGNHPPAFCRLMVNTRQHCFAEVSQHFPRNRSPLPLKCAIQSRLQDGWSISFSDRKPLAASSLVRRRKGIGVCMPDATTIELLQAFLKLRGEVCTELGISPLTDDTIEAYTTHVQSVLAGIREAVQQKSFAIALPQYYARKLSLIKTKPEYVWLGDYPSQAEQRRQQMGVPVSAH